MIVKDAKTNRRIQVYKRDHEPIGNCSPLNIINLSRRTHFKLAR